MRHVGLPFRGSSVSWHAPNINVTARFYAISRRTIASIIDQRSPVTRQTTRHKRLVLSLLALAAVFAGTACSGGEPELLFDEAELGIVVTEAGNGEPTLTPNAPGRTASTEDRIGITVTSTRSVDLIDQDAADIADAPLVATVTRATTPGSAVFTIDTVATDGINAIESLGSLPQLAGSTISITRPATDLNLNTTVELNVAERSKAADLADALALLIPPLPPEGVRAGMTWTHGYERIADELLWRGSTVYSIRAIGPETITIDFERSEQVIAATAPELTPERAEGMRRTNGSVTVSLTSGTGIALEAETETELERIRSDRLFGVSRLDSQITAALS